MSEPIPINQDEQHLQLLRIFHFVCAGLAALFAFFPGIYLAIGLLILFKVGAPVSAKNAPPAFMGWILVIIGSTFILIGWTFAGLLAWAGKCLGQRRHYMFCVSMGGVACIFMPFGTVLGVFTLIVLTRPSVRALFDKPLAGGSATA